MIYEGLDFPLLLLQIDRQYWILHLCISCHNRIRHANAVEQANIHLPKSYLAHTPTSSNEWVSPIIPFHSIINPARMPPITSKSHLITYSTKLDPSHLQLRNPHLPTLASTTSQQTRAPPPSPPTPGKKKPPTSSASNNNKRLPQLPCSTYLLYLLTLPTLLYLPAYLIYLIYLSTYLFNLPT